MSSELRKLVGVLLASAVGMTALIVLAPKLLGAAAGPEVEILTELKEAESKGLELEAGFSEPLRSKKVGFQRISVSVEAADRATVTATLDFDGKVLATAVSSLGAERVPYVFRDGTWEPAEGHAPRLVSVVRALEKRRAALEKGDVSKLCSGRADGGESSDLGELLRIEKRRIRAVRWLIRSERDDVLVTEESRVTGTLPERPVDDRVTRRLTLQPAPGGEFCFPEGLM